MTITTIKMLKADYGKFLRKGDVITTAVLLKEGETEEGWDEILESDIPSEEEPEEDI